MHLRLEALVGDRHAPRLAVELEEHRAGAVGVRLAHGEQPDHERLARLDLHAQFLARRQPFEERRRRQHADVGILRRMSGVVFEHARIEEPREHLAGRGGAAHDLGRLLARRMEVGRRQRFTRPARHHLAVAHNPFHDGRWESTWRLPHSARHEVDHRLRESELAGIGEQVGGVHAVRDEHQCEVAHRFARGGHLHDVAEQVIHVGVGAAHLLPAVAEAEGLRLLQEIRELATRHFVQIEIGVGRLHVALEGRVVVANRGPVVGQLSQWLRVEAGIERGVAGGVDEGVEIRLARQASKRGECGIDHAGAVPGGFEERRHLGARCIVRVEVDRDADFSPQGRHQLAGGERLAEARHVLDGEHVGAKLFQLLAELHVVVE